MLLEEKCGEIRRNFSKEKCYPFFPDSCYFTVENQEPALVSNEVFNPFFLHCPDLKANVPCPDLA